MENDMKIFDEISKREHEQVVFFSNKEANLRAIIAIHDTTLGPALGGTRMWMYATENDALIDVLRLSRGMTYKAAVSGLNLGGGKAVIIGDPHKDKDESMFRAFGRFVDGLAGRYITAEDVGTTVEDMEYVRMETKYVTGIDRALGGSGDPSPFTAYGVYVGMKACMKELTGSDSLVGKKVAVQGAGHVAKFLCERLAKEGAKIFVSDIYEDKAKAVAAESKAELVHPDKIYDVDADVFCPCALGAIINDETLPRMKFKVIAGGANNQLADENKHGQILLDRGIIYAPDYAINAGGLINVAAELGGYHPERAMKQAGLIYDTIRKILEIAKKERIPAHQASNKLAEERIRSIGSIRQIYSGKSEFAGRLGEMYS
jgi:leucine dehydrogenase